MRDGVSDMHCMSDLYLAEELKEEYERRFLEPYEYAPVVRQNVNETAEE